MTLRWRCMNPGCEDVPPFTSWAASERHADAIHGLGAPMPPRAARLELVFPK